MSFQLPVNPLAFISKLPFVGKLPIASMGNLPKNGNLLIEAKGFAGSWNDIGISISQYSFLPIIIYSAVHWDGIISAGAFSP